MRDDLLEQIVEILTAMDSKMGTIANDIDRIERAVSEMRMDICGFEHEGRQVRGHLSQIVDALSEIESAVHMVDGSVQSVDVSIGSLDLGVSVLSRR